MDEMEKSVGGMERSTGETEARAGATWNRKIEDGGDYLTVGESAQNPNPPPAPGHGSREDTANDITTFGPDRGDTGAKILYHAIGGVILTGISMKDGGEIPDGLSAGVNPAGKLLTLTDTGEAGTIYDYYVQGTVDGTAKQSQDPRIRNQA